MDSFVDLNLASEKFENCTEDSPPEWKSGFNDFSRMDDTEVYRHCSIVWKVQYRAHVALHYFYFNAQKLTPYSFSGFQLSTAGWPILKVWLIIFPLPTPPPLRAKGIWQMWWSWCALEFWRDRVTLISDDICKLSNAVSTDKSRSFRLVPQWRVARYPGTKSSAWIVGKNSNWNPL